MDADLLVRDHPIDIKKVERLKAALASHAYPVRPQAIASAMLASRHLLEICE